MKFMAYTFVRTSEEIEASWTEFDLDEARWIAFAPAIATCTEPGRCYRGIGRIDLKETTAWFFLNQRRTLPDQFEPQLYLAGRSRSTYDLARAVDGGTLSVEEGAVF